MAPLKLSFPVLHASSYLVPQNGNNRIVHKPAYSSSLLEEAIFDIDGMPEKAIWKTGQEFAYSSCFKTDYSGEFDFDSIFAPQGECGFGVLIFASF